MIMSKFNFHSISAFAEMSFSDVMFAASDATLSVSCVAVLLVESGVIVMVGDGTSSEGIGIAGEAAGFVMRS